jgi:elongation factor P
MNNETYDQYELKADQVDENWKWIKEGTVCKIMLYNGLPVTMEPPQHVNLKVEYCEPGARGDTATNVTKSVKLETNAEVLAPLFINQGDTLRINTQTGEYVERIRV